MANWKRIVAEVKTDAPTKRKRSECEVEAKEVNVNVKVKVKVKEEDDEKARDNNQKEEKDTGPGLKKQNSDASIDEGPRTVASDGIEIDSTGSTIRDKCIDMLYVALATDNHSEAELIKSRAIKTEATIYLDHGSSTSPAYKTKIRALYLNLKDRRNPSLREAVVCGDLPVARLCTMSVAVKSFTSLYVALTCTRKWHRKSKSRKMSLYRWTTFSRPRVQRRSRVKPTSSAAASARSESARTTRCKRGPPTNL